MIITTLLFCLYRNDSINTGYMDPHNIEHSVATAVSTFRVASHSVSDIIARILMLHASVVSTYSGEGMAWSKVSN